MARWLVEQGARHLVLMGRSGASPVAQQTIGELAKAGAEIRIAQADVAQTGAVAAVLNELKESMPPLRGVIHAAGLLDDSSLLNLDQARFERVTAPKIDGAWNLHQLTQGLPLEFFILFSSATAILGTPGQTNYAAANAFMDALAHYRQAQGLPALSLNWGPWSEVGLAAVQANRGERLAQRGLGSITPEQGVVALARLFHSEASQVAVMPFDLAQWTQFYPAAGKSPLFSHLRQPQAETAAQPQETTLREALLAVEAGHRRQTLLETHLREQVAQVLRLAASRVPLNQPLKNLGLDSLMTLELRNRLELSLGVTLSATLIWNYPTVAALAPFLAEKMGISLTTTEGSTEPQPEVEAKAEPEDKLAQLDDLSQDEVEALLAEELAAIDDLLN
jgi:acyl carrier protein/short-subunit dehydrogenase